MRCVSVSSSCFDLAQIVENSHAFGENGAARKRQTVLRQVSGDDPFRDGQRSVIERLHPADHLQQRGLAGAVGADKADAVLRRDQPVEIFEQEFVAEAFAGAR